jgi:hypothetical protein
MSFIEGLLLAGEELASAAGQYLLPALGKAATEYIGDKLNNQGNPQGARAAQQILTQYGRDNRSSPHDYPPPHEYPSIATSAQSIHPQPQPLPQHSITSNMSPQGYGVYAPVQRPIVHSYAVGDSEPLVRQQRVYRKKKGDLTEAEIRKEIARLKALKKKQKSLKYSMGDKRMIADIRAQQAEMPLVG